MATVLGYYRNLGERHIGLNAEVVEMAPGDVYQPFSGVIDSIDVDNQQFVLHNQQNLLTTITFHPETKVFSRLGEPMQLADLTLDMTVRVEGVYNETAEQIYAAVIFVDASEKVEQLTGSVQSLHDDLTGFGMTDDAQGDVCVTVDENTNIYLLSIENDSFSSVPSGFSELQSGQHIEVYGTFNLGCFVAKNILLESL